MRVVWPRALPKCAEDAPKNFDKRLHEYAMSFPDQGIMKREESVDVLHGEVPESEDLLMTVTSKYRQLQRETAKQVIYVGVPLDCVNTLDTAGLYCRTRGEDRLYNRTAHGPLRIYCAVESSPGHTKGRTR